MRRVEIYDSTLRDGTQGEGVAFSVDDKLRIARKLDELGIHYIEGGWPGSNPRDAAFFKRARDLGLRHARLAAFGATCRVGGSPDDDPSLRALVEAETPVTTVVGKTWPLHVTEVLRTTLEENLRVIRESVAWLKARGRTVFYDAEHFFDGYRADPGYALETLRAAGKADVVVLCDTNGGWLPWEVEEVVRAAGTLGVPLGIHAHDDGGLAVANSLAAVRAGAVQVQGTINGYGERVGNANLCAVIPDLKLKMGIECVTGGELRRLTEVSRFVSELANLPHPHRQPYVGASAFAHKGGIHVSAVMRCEQSYQHVDPSLVGNEKRVLCSDLAGRGNILYKAAEFGLEGVDPATAATVLERIKQLENGGFSFESAEASVEMMIRRARSDYAPPFELVDFMVIARQEEADATVKVMAGGQVVHVAASGNGPVHALDTALRKALRPYHPEIAAFELDDYKVRILDGRAGTSAKVRVLVDTRMGTRRWTTVGASTNILSASAAALVDSLEYGLAVAAPVAR